MDPFRVYRQTIAFLGVLAGLELMILLVFPLVSVLFGAVAAPLLVLVWVKAGIRTGKWLWWNPVAVPLTQVEGAVTLSAALMFSVGILVTGYEGIRYASGERLLLAGYAWPRLDYTPPVGSRSVNYSDPIIQQVLKDELAKAGVPYTLDTKDGKEYIAWTSPHNAAADAIQRKLHEGPSPSERSVSFSNSATQDEFKQWLLKRSTPFEIVIMRGQEFVVWKEGDKDLAMQFMKERAVPCPEGAAASTSDTTKQKQC